MLVHVSVSTRHNFSNFESAFIFRRSLEAAWCSFLMKISKNKYRFVMKHFSLKGNTSIRIKFWINELKCTRTSWGHDQSSRSNIAQVLQMVLKDRRIKVRETAESICEKVDRILSATYCGTNSLNLEPMATASKLRESSSISCPIHHTAQLHIPITIFCWRNPKKCSRMKDVEVRWGDHWRSWNLFCCSWEMAPYRKVRESLNWLYCEILNENENRILQKKKKIFLS